MNDDLLPMEARPKRADALENHALLLKTARQLFEDKGVEHVTMSAVAEAAGVGKGTLYRHFTNKVQLIQALLDEEQRALQEQTFARLAAPGDPAAQLRWFLGAAFAFVSRNLPLLNVDGMDTAISMLSHPAHLWWRKTIRGLLGRTRTRLDADYVADILYVMLDPRTICYQRNTVGYDVDRVMGGLLMTLESLLEPQT
jgi:AcrR family transcriptional regulator